VGPGALRDVVDDDGDAQGVQRPEVVVDLVEGGLQVVRGDDQDARDACVPGPAGQLEGLPGGGAAGARQDRHPPVHLVQADLNGPLPFLQGHVREFARGAAGDDAVHVGQDVPDEAPVRLLVQPVVPGEGGHQGRVDASEPVGFVAHGVLLCVLFCHELHEFHELI
jgi:hypothetical protein